MHWQSGILHFSPQKHNIQKNKEEEEEEKPRNDISPTRPTKEARNMLTRDMVPFVLTTYQSTTNWGLKRKNNWRQENQAKKEKNNEV